MGDSQTWVTSDTHFGHDAIVELEAFGHHIRRPFQDSAEMDIELIRRWNAQVRAKDTVFHLGDLAWTTEALDRVSARLNGHKKLLLGNHDTLDASTYQQAGFEIVNGNYSHRTPHDEWVMLSHAPGHESCLSMPGLNILGNVHGHIHEKEEPTPMHLNGVRLFFVDAEQGLLGSLGASGGRTRETLSDPSEGVVGGMARRGAVRQYYPISTSLGVRTRRCSALRGSASTHQDRDWLVAEASEPPRL